MMHLLAPILFIAGLFAPRVAHAADDGSDDLRRLLAPLVATKVELSNAAIPGGATMLTFDTTETVAVTWARLETARLREGWRLVARYPSLAGHVEVTLERRRRRLTVLLGPSRPGQTSGGLQLAPVPRRTARLSGSCVKVPELRFEIMLHASARSSLGRHYGRSPLASSTRWTFRTRYDYDFDGDGLLDALVPEPKRAFCPSSVRHAIYITRCHRGRCCGHHVGVVGGGEIDVDGLRKTRTDRSGLKPIETHFERTERRTRIPDRVSYRRRYVFRRGRYRLDSEKRRTGRCHHCSTPSCSGPINIYRCPLALPERLDFAAITAGMAQVARRAQVCAKKPLKTAAGRVARVSVTVDKSGVVKATRFYTDDPVAAPLRRCIRQALAKTRFPLLCAREPVLGARTHARALMYAVSGSAAARAGRRRRS